MDEGLKATQKAVAAQRTPCAFVLPERVQWEAGLARRKGKACLSRRSHTGLDDHASLRAWRRAMRSAARHRNRRPGTSQLTAAR